MDELNVLHCYAILSFEIKSVPQVCFMPRVEALKMTTFNLHGTYIWSTYYLLQHLPRLNFFQGNAMLFVLIIFNCYNKILL